MRLKKKLPTALLLGAEMATDERHRWLNSHGGAAVPLKNCSANYQKFERNMAQILQIGSEFSSPAALRGFYRETFQTEVNLWNIYMTKI